MSLNLDEKETRAFLIILENRLDDLVSVVRKAGYDQSVFFIGGDARGLDFRGSNLVGVSFRDADVSECKFYRSQFELVLQTGPRDTTGVMLFEPDNDQERDEVYYKRAIGQTKRVVEARELYEQMKNDGVALSDGLLASIISKAGSLSEARNLQNELDPESSVAGIETFNILIGKTNKKYHDALELLDTISERSLRPNAETFHRVISNAKYSDGVSLLLRMERENIPATSGIFATLTAKAPTPEAATNMFKEAIARNIDVDRSLVHSALRKCTSLTQAREILDLAEGSKFEPDTQTYNMLLSFAERFESAAKMVSEMLDLGIPRDKETIRRLLGKSNNFEQVLSVAEEAEASGLSDSDEIEEEIQKKIEAFGPNVALNTDE